MGDRDATIAHETEVRRHRLRIRTVAVSFKAAVRSARRDPRVIGVAERDAFIELWRAWSLQVLEGYEAETRRLSAADPELRIEGRSLRDELEAAIRAVRHA